MTEDDTFNALRKTPASMMPSFYESWLRNDNDDRTIFQFIEDHHWSKEELAVWHQNYISPPND